MIINKTDMKQEIRKEMRGGNGDVLITHMVPSDSMKNARLMAELSLSPGSGIGSHRHNKETEYYIITEGSGIVIEDDGSKSVKKGDIVVTGNGASHSIENTGNTNLKFIAVIITE
jgi:mannose-6-phosphate isomerase-like protein (cupin superfamily)